MQPPFRAYKGSEPYVFVCYAHADASLVFAELERLRADGLNIFCDEGIAPGSEWTQELADAIDGCAYFLYFVSPDAVASRYCRNEVQYALEQHKPVICVHLEPTDLPGGLKLALGTSQALMKHELREVDYQQKLTEALDGKPGDRSPPSKAANYNARRTGRVAAVGVGVLALVFVVVSLVMREPEVAEPATIAVMPFEGDDTTEAEQELIDGFAIELGDQLGKISVLRVTARSAVRASLAEGLHAIEVGRRLGASHVVEGSLRFRSEQVAVSVQLIDVATQTEVWSETLQAVTDRFPKLPNQVAVDVGTALGARLTEAERSSIVASGAHNLEAYRLYNRFHFAGADPQQNQRAMQLLEETIEFDPEFTDAIARLAFRKSWACWYGDRASCAEIRPLADRAMALDARSGMAHHALARAEITAGRVGLAVQLLHRAHALEPSRTSIANELSTFAGLVGDLEESLAAGIQAVRVDPTDIDAQVFVAVALRRLGDLPTAQRWVERCLARTAQDNPRRGRLLNAEEWLVAGNGAVSISPERMRFAWANLSQVPMIRAAWGSALLLAGEWAELGRWLEPLAPVQPDLRPGLDDVPLARTVRTLYAFALLNLGESELAAPLLDASLDFAQRVVDRGVERPLYPLEMAAIHAVRQEEEAALRWLEVAYERGVREHRYLRLDPMFETLQGNAAFEAVLGRMQRDAQTKLANARALGLLDDVENLLSGWEEGPALAGE